MATFRHNKKRNTGLMHEFLIRSMGRTMLDRNTMEYQKSLAIIRRHFGDSSPLRQELELFDVIRSTRGVSENLARRILSEVQRSSRDMNQEVLEGAKSTVIREINKGFGMGFWDQHRIPDYRLLATIQMVINTARSGKPALTESVQSIQLEENLVQWMTAAPSSLAARPMSGDIDKVVMAIAVKKFQERYSRNLSPRQQTLMERYIRSQITGDQSSLLLFVEQEKRWMSSVMARATKMQEFADDAAMMKRLDESWSKLNQEQTHSIDQIVEDMMLYQRLFEEIESDA